MTEEANTQWIRELYHQVKGSAAKRKIAFSLTQDDLSALVNRSGLCCELTGIPFDLRVPRAALGLKHFKRPWFPSVDRIDSSKGYQRSNVRLVCVAVNYAVGSFGDEIFLRILDAGRTDRRSILQARYRQLDTELKNRQECLMQDTVAESALPRWLGIKSDLIPKARQLGTGPPHRTVTSRGHLVRQYKIADVIEWLIEQKVDHRFLIPVEHDLLLDHEERMVLWMRQLEQRVGQLEKENRRLRHITENAPTGHDTVEKLQKESSLIRYS